MKKSKGFTLLEALIALIVVGTVSLIYLKYEVQSIKRQQMLGLASFLSALDKAFYSADELVQYPLMPITSCNGYTCLAAGSSYGLGFINNLINTKSWLYQVNNPPQNFPQNFLDPSFDPNKIIQNYILYVYASPDQQHSGDYDIDEIEVKKTNGHTFSAGEMAILYNYLGNRICIDSNGNLHYFLNNTAVPGVSSTNLNCPGSFLANYYIVKPQQ